MNVGSMVLELMRSCANGRLGAAECGPIWQLSVIAVLLVLAVVTLVVLRLRSHAAPEKA